MALEYGESNRRRAVHFDTKTTLWIIFSSLALAAGLFVWGMNIQERVGIVEQQNVANEQQSLIRHNALSRRIDERANITSREIDRIEVRFDKLDETLIRIEDKLDRKVDRNGQ